MSQVFISAENYSELDRYILFCIVFPIMSIIGLEKSVHAETI